VHSGNGVILPVSGLPQAPAGTISQLLQRSGFSFLLSVFNHSHFSRLIAGPLDTITLMAPTDQAFINAGYPDTTSLLATGVGHLDSLVAAHVMGYHTSDKNVFAYDPAHPGIFLTLFPAGVTRQWIIPGLPHNGHLFLTAQTSADTYLYTMQYENTTLGYGYHAYDLGYQSDGSNYGFYRQVFTTADSAVVGNVLTPNIIAVNGLIHTIDHVLPQH
jgi:hypothetical protein